MTSPFRTLLQGAFELIAAQCPLAVASMLSGIGRRLAAASAIRSHRSMYDPSGRAAVATPVPATSSMRNGAAGGGAARRGEVVTVVLVPAGPLTVYRYATPQHPLFVTHRNVQKAIQSRSIGPGCIRHTYP